MCLNHDFHKTLSHRSLKHACNQDGSRACTQVATNAYLCSVHKVFRGISTSARGKDGRVTDVTGRVQREYACAVAFIEGSLWLAFHGLRLAFQGLLLDHPGLEGPNAFEAVPFKVNVQEYVGDNVREVTVCLCVCVFYVSARGL